VPTDTESSATPSTSFLRLQARSQRFTLGTPREFRVSPDGRRVLFLRSASGTERRNSLLRVDVETGKETVVVDPVDLLGGDEELTPQERARRERTRTQSAGVVGYATDEQFRIAVFTLSGKLFVADLSTDEVRELPATGAVIDPRPDPTGTHIAYVAGGTLRVIGVDGTGDRALAEPEGGDTENLAWGLAEFLAAEEMGRTRGYWWSPEGTRLLAARTDRTEVPRWHIADPANPDKPANTVAYPAAGTTNVRVTLTVLGLDGSRTAVDWDDTALPYLASAHWSAAGDPLIAVQSRDQRRMVLLSVDPATGAATVREEVTDEHWVDVVPGAPALRPDGALVNVRALDGAYRLTVDGQPATPVELQVRQVLDVDANDILFTASADDPTQAHVYTLADGVITRISQEPGVHSAYRGGGSVVLFSWSLDHEGPVTQVRRGDGGLVTEITAHAIPAGITPNLTLLTVGERELRCALLLPTGHRPGSAKLPVLLDPYGGPHAQRVLQARNAYLTPQWLADQGFAVLIADGRGTPGRGPAWDRAIHHELAEITLADQVDALHAVAARYPDLDTERVGIRGWSYGGYLAALAVLRRPDVFRAAVAGAPVTDWRLYDTHYTERYLGHPDQNPEVYQRNSLLDDAEGLRGSLLLIHGLADDNVFAAHTLRLSSALLAAGRSHTVLPLSGVTHMSPTAEREAENFMLLQLNWLKHTLGV
jgi:dipeptidyl-peptidase-4